MSEPIDLNRWRDNDGLVKVNYPALVRKLQLRGKTWSALKEAHVGYEILHKIKQGQPIAARTFRKIVVQLAAWPELEHAADLIS